MYVNIPYIDGMGSHQAKTGFSSHWRQEMNAIYSALTMITWAPEHHSSSIMHGISTMCVYWVGPLPSSTHHQGYYIFLSKIPTQIDSFASGILGGGVDPTCSITSVHRVNWDVFTFIITIQRSPHKTKNTGVFRPSWELQGTMATNETGQASGS